MIRIAPSLLFVVANMCHTFAHSDRMSRHLLIEDLSMVVLVAEAEQVQGPFPGEDEDYISTPDITATGRAGSPGLSEDRLSVVDGVPLTLTLNIYDVANNATGGVEFENVEVTIWSCDTIGVYSAVSDGNFFQPNVMGVGDQIWLRGRQVTGADGKVMFKTIMPGWYPDRSIHYHIRLRFPGQEDFAATTQLYIADDDLALFQHIEPYVSNAMTEKTPLGTDFIYTALDPAVGELLLLNLNGSVATGFSASVDLGLVPGAVSDFPGEWTLPPNLSPLAGSNTMSDGEGGVVTTPTSSAYSKNDLMVVTLLAACVRFVLLA